MDSLFQNYLWLFTTLKGGVLLALCALILIVVKILAGRLFPEKGESDPSNFLNLHFLNDLPNPSGSDCPTDLVDAPPFPKEIQAIPTVEIIRRYKVPINRLVRESSLSEEDVNAFLLPAVEKLVQIVHLLPASQEDHHSYEGGLLTHSLETATNAVIAAQNHIFDADEMPGQKYQNKQRWVLAAAIGGLAHDLGKVIRDIRVVDADTHKVKRMDLPMKNWIKRYSVRAYSINWTGDERTPKSHQGDSHFLLRSLLSDSIVNFLCYERNPKIYQALRDAVYDMSSGPLGKILQDADIRSASDDQVHRAQLSANNQIVQTSNASQICHAIQMLLTSGKWTYNHADSMVFVTREGCFLRWEESESGDNQTSIEISKASRQLANETHTNYVPRSRSIMFDNLVHGRVLLQREKEGGYFWSICPITAKNKYIRCLRFHNAQHLFGFDMVPNMIEAHVYGSEASLRQKTAWLKEYGEIPDTFNHQEGTTPILKMESLIRKALGLIQLDNETQAYLDVISTIRQHAELQTDSEAIDSETGEIRRDEKEEVRIPDTTQGSNRKKKNKPVVQARENVSLSRESSWETDAEPKANEDSTESEIDKVPDSGPQVWSADQGFQEEVDPVSHEFPEYASDEPESQEDALEEQLQAHEAHQEALEKGKNRILSLINKPGMGNKSGKKGKKKVPRETKGKGKPDVTSSESTPMPKVTEPKPEKAEPQKEDAFKPKEEGAKSSPAPVVTARTIGEYKKIVNELRGEIRAKKGKLLGNTQGKDEVSLALFYKEADARGLDRISLESLLKASGIDVNFSAGSVRIR